MGGGTCSTDKHLTAALQPFIDRFFNPFRGAVAGSHSSRKSNSIFFKLFLCGLHQFQVGNAAHKNSHIDLIPLLFLWHKFSYPPFFSPLHAGRASSKAFFASFFAMAAASPTKRSGSSKYCLMYQ